MILIFAQHITPRLNYITKFLFTGILKASCKVTDNVDEYVAHTGPKINYSFQSLEGIQLIPKSLLFKKAIENVEVEVVWQDGLPLLFHQCGDVPLPFDPFAASFYMATRYEEYINKMRDQHGRFLGKWSLAGMNNFINIPVVDHWALLLKQTIKKAYPDYNFPEREYAFLPTIDVDSVAAYKGKSAFRSAGAAIKELFRGDFASLNLRIKVLYFDHHDPLDTFEQFHQWHNEFNLAPYWFFLVGKHSKYDGNLPLKSTLMQQTLKSLAIKYSIGLHPSYYSYNSPETIAKEKTDLESIIGKKIYRSRQHFLKMEIPITYKTLIKCGIKEDYTMGFSDQPGFRAGTCTPFPFYDLETEKETGLMIYPLTVMDATFIKYLNSSPENALQICTQLASEVKKVKGTFISLWHNSFIHDAKHHTNWSTFYQELIRLAIN